jgi:hypothetical protein
MGDVLRSHHAEPEDGGADDRHDPVDLGLCGPAIPEEPNRDKKGATNECRNAELWLAFAAVTGAEL